MKHVITTVLLSVVLAGCASVNTQIVPLDPTQHYAPTQNVEVLLDIPKRPFVEIALIESRGDVGRSEADLLNDAREKAKTVGADAIIKLETERVYHQPVTVYDPWYDPFFYGWYPYRPYMPYPHPWGSYRVIGGGYSYVLKAIAIKYRDNS